MSIRIVTDSACDLPAEVAAELGITVIPCYINVDGQSYRDGVDITRRQFYERLPDWKASPTTSAPGIDVFRTAYQRLADEGASQIISLHLSQRLSNLANIASLAADAFHSVPVQVVPVGFLTLAGGFVAIAAARAAQAGASLNEILELIANLSPRIYLFAGLSTLEFLRRSGRVSHLKARLGAWLDILPVVKLHLDIIDMETARTRTRVIERVLRLVSELGPLEDLGVLHTNAPERAAALAASAAQLFPAGKAVHTVDVTPLLGVHVGPNAVGLVAVKQA